MDLRQYFLHPPLLEFRRSRYQGFRRWWRDGRGGGKRAGLSGAWPGGPAGRRSLHLAPSGDQGLFWTISKKGFFFDKAIFLTYYFPHLLTYISHTQGNIWFSNIDKFGKAGVLNLFTVYVGMSMYLFVPSV